MWSILALSLTATIIAIQQHELALDEGLIDGLRAGDKGRVHYTLKVNGCSRTIEFGSLEITKAYAFAARVQILGQRGFNSGYQVTFLGLPDRVTPAELLRIASELDAGQLKVSRGYFLELQTLFLGC